MLKQNVADVRFPDTANPSTTDDAEPWPDPRQAWVVVVILCIAYAISFIDRQVINLLTEELKRDLGVSDLQIGMLQGLAFGVFYTVMGMPLGRLSDSMNRRNVIIAGAFVWSVMTALSGIARSFSHLFLARIGVGVGEAALTPAAMSIISDYFPPDRRALPLSVYVTGTSLGGGLALLIGGWVVTYVTALGPVEWPLLGRVAPWQAVFLSVGLPSLLLVPLLATIREPLRRGLMGAGHGAGKRLPLRAGVAFIWQRRGVYLSHNLGLAAVSVFTYGVSAWTPALFIRRFGWSAADVGLAYGIITLVCGMGGVLTGGWVANRLRAAGHRDANWKVMATGVFILVPTAILAPLAPTPAIALLLYLPLTFFSTFPYGVGAAALQEVTPNQLRAQVSALYLFALGLLGLGLGPTGVGAFTDHVFGDPLAVGRSMALLSALVGPVAIAGMWIGGRHYRRLLEDRTWKD